MTQSICWPRWAFSSSSASPRHIHYQNLHHYHHLLGHYQSFNHLFHHHHQNIHHNHQFLYELQEDIHWYAIISCWFDDDDDGDNDDGWWWWWRHNTYCNVILGNGIHIHLCKEGASGYQPVLWWWWWFIIIMVMIMLMVMMMIHYH